MMMPILEQSPAHHHHLLHGYAHPAFYRQQLTPEPSGKMQLTLILPNGVPSVLTVDANTPMMDLLIQASSLNKLNPSGYSLVVLDSNQHVIHYKPNQTVGQIVNNCHLPQMNGSSTISLLPKETPHSTIASKTKSQPFEITVRLQVNLPDAQKILLRVDPTLPLNEIKELVCKQKKYIHSNEYILCYPHKLDQPLLLGLSLAECKTNELTLVHRKTLAGQQSSARNQLQSFDRLYRARSESQSAKEISQETSNEQQTLTNTTTTTTTTTSTASSVPANNARSSTLRPSHTTLHAYWNDPNFDTQSQISNSSSTTKKRRAPRAPGCVSPSRCEQQIVYIQQQHPPLHTNSPSPPIRRYHHQSRESLISENTRQKRKAPIAAPIINAEFSDEKPKIEQQPTGESNGITRPGVEPPPPPENKAASPSIEKLTVDISPRTEVDLKKFDEPQKIDIKMNAEDGQRLLSLLQTQTATSAKLVITTESPEAKTAESPTPASPPIEENKESIPVQSPIVISEVETKETVTTSTPNEVVPPSAPVEAVQVKSPVPKPPRQSANKEKKSSSITGLLRIINDHADRAQIYQEQEKQQQHQETKENVSYFRVAKSRFGKFETESQGFINDATQNNQHQSKEIESSKRSNPEPLHEQVKQANDTTKRNEKEEEQQQRKSHINAVQIPVNNAQDKTPVPIQLEVTERTTHITVTVESDGKQMFTRVSPVSREVSPTPPTIAPKPSTKTITEYRTIRRVGNSGEILSSTNTVNKRAISKEDNPRLNSNSSTSHESLMESIRQFGGSQNLKKI